MIADGLLRSLFRVARPAPTAWNVAKTAAQAALLWAVFLVVVPLGIRLLEVAAGVGTWRLPHPAVVVAGVVLLVAASALNVWAAQAMSVHGQGTPLPLDAARLLVVRGPYRVVRNPMAIAGIGQGVAVGVILGSPFVIVYALVGALYWQFAVRPLEEADLARRFGEAYARYRTAVKCWVPRRTPYAPS